MNMSINRHPPSSRSAVVPPSVIAHRGACGHAPENTLPAIRKAAEIGVQWVEFDTQLSADGTVVVFHDEKLERTSNGSGMVEETDWEVLRGLDAGGWFGEEFKGEPIPTLRQVLPLLAELGLGGVIDVKPAVLPADLTGRSVANILREEWPASLPTPMISSFTPGVLAASKEVFPELPRALVVWKTPEDWRKQLEELDCAALHCNHKFLTEELAAAVIEAGYTVRCFVVDDRDRAETLFGWGVESMFSDYPDRILAK